MQMLARPPLKSTPPQEGRLTLWEPGRGLTAPSDPPTRATYPTEACVASLWVPATSPSDGGFPDFVAGSMAPSRRGSGASGRILAVATCPEHVAASLRGPPDDALAS